MQKNTKKDDTMKRMTFLFALLIFGEAALVHSVAATPTTQEQLTAEQIAARRSGKRERMLRKTGGFLMRIPENAGCFKVINAQSKVSSDSLSPFVKDMGRFTSTLVMLESHKESVTIDTASLLLQKYGANGCLFIVDNDSYPISLVAQEAKWGMVNVAALRTDGADQTALALRTAREAWRVFALVVGAGDTSMGHCLLKPVFAAEDIDKLSTNSISPEPLLAIKDHMDAMGIRQVSRCTYLEACQEGWAPVPTNEYQKAIWDKVHAIPKNPMKIEFDPKRGR